MAHTETPPGSKLEAELSGLDALELPAARRRTRGARLWAAFWPKLMASAIFFFGWQVVVWTGWKPEYLLPAPLDVIGTLFDNFDTLTEAAGTTLFRAVEGFALAVVIGSAIGALVARNRIVRSGIGSMISGLQTMPSVAWFPLAILLFQLTEGAILFVVVLGAAPSIANGLITGIDNISPVLVRAGKVLGARGLRAFRYVILPAALPAFIGGLKQGWAFAWRSLLAGELLVLIPGTYSLGQQLKAGEDLNDSQFLIATMMVLFVVGVFMDALIFGTADRAVRKRYGLIDQATAS